MRKSKTRGKQPFVTIGQKDLSSSKCLQMIFCIRINNNDSIIGNEIRMWSCGFIFTWKNIISTKRSRKRNKQRCHSLKISCSVWSFFRLYKNWIFNFPRMFQCFGLHDCFIHQCLFLETNICNIFNNIFYLINIFT